MMCPKSMLLFILISPLAADGQISIPATVQDTLNKSLSGRTARELKEIRITSKKQLIEKQIDRTVFTIENTIAGTGSDALEVLGKIPGLRADDHSVSLAGKGSLSVMINDRLINLSAEDLSNYLKSISSDNISKVEVITSPPAKYDAQGNNGLINIILKKQKDEGLQGSITGSYSKASYFAVTGSGDISYRNRKFSVSSGFSIRDGSVYPQESSSIFYPKQTWDILNRFRNFRKITSGQLAIDYQLSKKLLIGALYNGSHTDFHSDEEVRSRIYNPAGNQDSLLLSQANAKISSGFSSAGLFFKQKIDTSGTQLLINADWFGNRNDSQRQFDNHTYINGNQLREGSFAQYLSSSAQLVDVYTLKADMDIPFQFYQLSFGSKLSFIRNASDIAFYQKFNDQYMIDQAQSNIFNYTENTQALYLNLNRKYNKWSLQTGLRGEYTQTRGISIISSQTTVNRYLRLFPTAFLHYRPDLFHTLSFSYSKRINRPPYRYLNPFRWYSNQYVYAEGNPFLKPSYNNNFELSHLYRNLITTTLSYSHTNNGYSNVNFTDTLSNQQVSKPVNFMTGNNYQLSNSLSVTQISWLQSNNEIDISYNRSASTIRGTAPGLARLSYYLSTSNQFYFVKDKTFSGELTFWYQFKNIDALQVREAQYNLNAGAKMLVLKKHVMLTASITDLLKSNIYRYSTVVNGIEQRYDNYYDTRQLRLSLRYTFGNEKLRQQNRQPGNTDETKRN
ncbi:Outer membrane receptor proteins, mostly Fe transport [Pedobacter westerhofensis]|uniref:Outer membrane receptor proteins, mostly Fe transport n=2 Tax=Pedobacter westerhofensis TaxID=425512 RepID=A0A521AJJ7_9SPHI|nr:Outer membrane receptor proteins, mostly Fe transport [Pedobacter westerhofensis]